LKARFFFLFQFPTHPRLFVAMAVLIVVFIFTDITSAIDTDAFQDAFLQMTLASVVVISIAVAIFQVINRFYDPIFVVRRRLFNLTSV
jgi:hypothetical protein